MKWIWVIGLKINVKRSWAHRQIGNTGVKYGDAMFLLVVCFALCWLKAQIVQLLSSAYLFVAAQHPRRFSVPAPLSQPPFDHTAPWCWRPSWAALDRWEAFFDATNRELFPLTPHYWVPVSIDTRRRHFWLRRIIVELQAKFYIDHGVAIFAMLRNETESILSGDVFAITFLRAN